MTMLKKYLAKTGEFKEGFPLSRISSIRIGGVCAGLWVPESLEGLLDGLKFLLSKGLDFKVISGGTNVLINDRKLDFIVIGLWEFKKIFLEGGFLKAGAGLKLAKSLSIAGKIPWPAWNLLPGCRQGWPAAWQIIFLLGAVLFQML